MLKDVGFLLSNKECELTDVVALEDGVIMNYNVRGLKVTEKDYQD
jgi:hypothetical protein